MGKGGQKVAEETKPLRKITLEEISKHRHPKDGKF